MHYMHAMYIYIYVKCMYNGIYVFIMICVYIMVYIYIHDDLCTFQDRRMFMTQASTAYNDTFYILHI